MANKKNLQKLVDAHWAAMKDPESHQGVAWRSYCKIREEAMILGDSEVIKFLKGDNYAVVDEHNINFGLAGLPVVVFLCKKYGFPLDSGYKTLQEEHRKKYQHVLAKAKKQSKDVED